MPGTSEYRVLYILYKKSTVKNILTIRTRTGLRGSSIVNGTWVVISQRLYGAVTQAAPTNFLPLNREPYHGQTATMTVKPVARETTYWKTRLQIFQSSHAEIQSVSTRKLLRNEREIMLGKAERYARA